MKKKFLFAPLAAVALLVAMLYFYGGSRTPAGQPPLRSLNAQNLAALKGEFNRASGETRVLLLLSPT